jgi:hypothetical protein
LYPILPAVFANAEELYYCYAYRDKLYIFWYNVDIDNLQLTYGIPGAWTTIVPSIVANSHVFFNNRLYVLNGSTGDKNIYVSDNGYTFTLFSETLFSPSCLVTVGGFLYCLGRISNSVFGLYRFFSDGSFELLSTFVTQGVSQDYDIFLASFDFDKLCICYVLNNTIRVITFNQAGFKLRAVISPPAGVYFSTLKLLYSDFDHLYISCGDKYTYLITPDFSVFPLSIHTSDRPVSFLIAGNYLHRYFANYETIPNVVIDSAPLSLISTETAVFPFEYSLPTIRIHEQIPVSVQLSFFPITASQITANSRCQLYYKIDDSTETWGSSVLTVGGSSAVVGTVSAEFRFPKGIKCEFVDFKLIFNSTSGAYPIKGTRLTYVYEGGGLLNSN